MHGKQPKAIFKVTNGVVDVVTAASSGTATTAALHLAFVIPAEITGGFLLDHYSTLEIQPTDSGDLARVKLFIQSFLNLKPIAEYLLDPTPTNLIKMSVDLSYTVANEVTTIFWGYNFDELKARNEEEKQVVEGEQLAMLVGIQRKMVDLQAQLDALQ